MNKMLDFSYLADSKTKTFILKVAIAEFLAFFVRHVCFEVSSKHNWLRCVSLSRQPEATPLFRSQTSQMTAKV